MEILIIALDGGDQRIIDALDMPFLQDLLREGCQLSVEEDLWSRGWVEFLSGLHGRESGGFYSKPILNQRREFESSFGGEDYEANPSIVPLWERINQRGLSVGILGINTTMPPPKVEGFFVAGPGGGVKAALDVPPSACYPDKIAGYLNQRDYIWEVRFSSSPVKEAASFFELLRRETQRRGPAFLDLCHQFRVNCGLLFSKAPVVVQNLAMVEIEELISSGGNPTSHIQREIVDFYKCLDESIREAFEVVDPDAFMLVSDHGAAPYKTRIDVNKFLIRIGAQKRKSAMLSAAIRAAKKMGRRLVPSRGRGATYGQIAKRVVGYDVDWAKSTAFGSRYVPGVYINDASRFGGPIVNENDRRRIIHEIIKKFNASEEARSLGLSASVYRDKFESATYNQMLPDIWIDKPDTVFFESGDRFVQPNPDYGRLDDLSVANRDQFTGIKGRFPILSVSQNLANKVEKDDERNLTLAYEILVRHLSL
jgi:predicted AlkP superfamily phosphohydrolase/phosphomutase